ncbi:type II toxin-antitoxin system VapC family toxin [Janibacter anophelis]|uniref:type II toxin-antitoxin system VapC family toxin n=1 Tax=Janibacter anophelis TaxID=319054 RepID=UPI000DF011EC|nr:type II toxin-antitoxin system VapC family toxin [Janibacter anophelis]
MIAVDTNVVSELMRLQPEPTVLRWAAALDDVDLAVPAVVAAELLRGLSRLPVGAKRTRLESALAAFFTRLRDGRILTLDARGAVEYAHVMTDRDRAGSPMSTMDALIAATCRSHGAALATRNTKDFVGCGLRVIDPWRG